ncbi:MAG: DUF4268 domain-containing protein [Brumimicrobium sp.]
MFTKEERKALHSEYWLRFKSFISSSRSVNNRRINWLNYPTGLKEIYVRLDINQERASFSIDIQSKDEGIRSIIWEQFLELKKVLENEMQIPGTWSEEVFNKAGQQISSIYWNLENVSIYNQKDEEKVFQFFKDKLVRFDRFYDVYKEILFGLIK